ncbi:TolC family protein [Myroides ceti]|uniref:TolC family protein n=1 Tax=Paenimyroides ceti TaxID=395087 RepID=A0ABT8CQL3_9FLAO|nr:TolC family protein [Paenimyroides ceti]MDN3706788.1 TolC family protein [Paenimyroides ceti]
MKKHTLKFGISCCLALVFHTIAYAQNENYIAEQELPYAVFLQMVGQNNKQYAAEKFNVDIAEANALTAKIFPDPEISITAFDNGERRMQMGYGFSSELTYTLELGGKRKARINLAHSESQLIQLLLADYFRNLRADATLSYLEAIKEQRNLDVKIQSYETIKKLCDADSIRLSLGAIAEIDAQQTKLEAHSLLNEVYEQEGILKTALFNMYLMTGSEKADILYLPKETFTGFQRTYNLKYLLTIAKENRTDLAAAVKNREVSQKMLQLAKANRKIDLGLTLGVQNNSAATNMEAPTPSFTTVSAGLSIPIKLSNRNKGELKAAQYAIEQSEMLYKQAELQIQAEVSQYYYSYLASQKQVQQFANGMLENAQKILDGKIYSYKRGETSLLEVLDARRTYNEIQQSYNEAQYALAAALVELQRAVAIWDINFLTK